MHKTTDATKILMAKVKDDPIRSEQVRIDMINAEVAQLVYRLRGEAGMTQAQLAQKAGCSTATIELLEDADFEGDSVSMLYGIADALGVTLNPAAVGFVHMASTKAALAHAI